nr:MAG TPA: hypothetical protein [Caudoviricetes sp.]DAW52095.1 MAG TPA: hypothetical protein [Caudoviricetes sp.]
MYIKSSDEFLINLFKLPCPIATFSSRRLRKTLFKGL